MSELKEEFEKKAEEIKKSNLSLDNDTLLELYGYYKQGLDGDCNIEEPGFFDLKAKSKYNAWNAHKGKLTKEKAMKYYIKKVNNLLK
jgi:acyl-CoA-binding protein